MSSYSKPWLSYEVQLQQLIDRGMHVTDHARALDYLERIGYYRLSGYWYPFRERAEAGATSGAPHKRASAGKADRPVGDAFRPGTRFEDAVLLCVFDKKLRLLVLDALERIEVALRVDVSHTLGRTDRFAYLKPELFHRNFSEKIDAERGITSHHEWVSRHAQLIKRSKEEFVRHNRTKYGLPLAIWVACEVWDFGTLSTLFGGMREADQDAISIPYGVSNGRVFATWLRSLNYLRNVCAHHSRLWNRNMVDQPKLPARETLTWITDFETDNHARARCYLPLLITRELLRAVNPSSSWPTRTRDHLESFPDLAHLGLNLAGMGAPKHWRTHWE
jgi:abortive infection bacteriophage resistance protein